MLTANLNCYAADALQDLVNLQWKNRIILVRSEHHCEQTVQTLEKEVFDIDDRDIVWFVFCESQINQIISNYSRAISPFFFQYIRQQYFKTKNGNVVLIGKDGGVKYTAEQLNFAVISQRIDSMPIRQEEMRE